MAKTEFGVDHPLAVKLWSKLLATEAYRRTYFSKFVGKTSDALIHEKVDLKKSAGDKITCGLRIQLQGEGVQGDATLEGSEEALQFYDDSIYIDQLRHATRTKGKMTEQRVPYNLRAESRDGLADWNAQRMDTALANHLCGNTAQTDTRFTGNNAVTAPTTNRIIRAGNQANDESLTSGNVFNLELVDVARERAETASTEAGTGPVIRPIMVNGEPMYVMFLHDYQVTSLRTESGGTWLANQRAAMQGGDVRDNPIFTGALGVHNGVILHKWSRITNGVNSSDGTAVANTKRAVLCGAQAAAVAFGSSNGSSRYSWKEEMFDYGNQLGVASGAIFGLKKTKYVPEDDSSTNAEDYGTIVVSTYATQATPS